MLFSINVIHSRLADWTAFSWLNIWLFVCYLICLWVWHFSQQKIPVYLIFCFSDSTYFHVRIKDQKLTKNHCPYLFWSKCKNHLYLYFISKLHLKTNIIYNKSEKFICQFWISFQLNWNKFWNSSLNFKHILGILTITKKI